MSANKDIADFYFSAFGQANIEGVKTCFSDDVSLRDWNIEVGGIDSVLGEYLNIFRSLSNLLVNYSLYI
jgi:hypothetical protein